MGVTGAAQIISAPFGRSAATTRRQLKDDWVRQPTKFWGCSHWTLWNFLTSQKVEQLSGIRCVLNFKKSSPGMAPELEAGR